VVHPVLLATSGLLSVDAAAVVELVGFLLMLAVLARWIYPPVMRIVEQRQKQIAEQLAAAEKARQEAEARATEEQKVLRQAQAEAQQIIERANRTSDQIRQQAQERAQEDARRITEQAKKDIDAQRQRAIQAIRAQLADIVTGAVARIVGESLDGERHRKLIENAIDEVEPETSAP
jgi:F-type H+-transporting ATPase subunit b